MVCGEAEQHEDRKSGVQWNRVRSDSEADLGLQGHFLLSGLQVPLLHSLLEPLQDKTDQQQNFTT